MKKIFKKIIPQWGLNAIRRMRLKHRLQKDFQYDLSRYITSHLFRETVCQEADLAVLQGNCHALEKGFSMPEFRSGFGEKRLQILIPECERFLTNYGKKSEQFLEIIKVLYEYRLCHQQLHIAVPQSIAAALDHLLAEVPEVSSDSVQLDFTKEAFFASRDAAFPDFSRSRHSCRNFTDEPVPMDLIRQAVRLAQSAPSSCNRQSVRIISVSNVQKIHKIFEHHGGNRGFGHKVKMLLLVAGYLPTYSGGTERHFACVDSGIFAMNLIYALHYQRLGAVILNWGMHQEDDVFLQKLLNVPEELAVTCLIAVGNVPDKFKVCSSPRKPLDKVLIETGA